MEKKVTIEQTGQLMSFTRQHFVEHYDLQAELTDHLANGIELQWAQNPDISFEAALQAEFRKFGIYGFADVVAERTKALSKRYYRLLWGYASHFFRLPVLLGSMAGVVAVYLVICMNYWTFPALMAAFIITGSTRLYIIRRNYLRKVKATGHKWLLEDLIFSAGSFNILFNVPLQLYVHFQLGVGGTLAWLLSLLIVLLAIYCYVSLWVIPARAHKHLAEAYPEYAMV